MRERESRSERVRESRSERVRERESKPEPRDRERGTKITRKMVRGDR